MSWATLQNGIPDMTGQLEPAERVDELGFAAMWARDVFNQRPAGETVEELAAVVLPFLPSPPDRPIKLRSGENRKARVAASLA